MVQTVCDLSTGSTQSSCGCPQILRKQLEIGLIRAFIIALLSVFPAPTGLPSGVLPEVISRGSDLFNSASLIAAQTIEIDRNLYVYHITGVFAKFIEYPMRGRGHNFVGIEKWR